MSEAPEEYAAEGKEAARTAGLPTSLLLHRLTEADRRRAAGLPAGAGDVTSLRRLRWLLRKRRKASP